MELRHLRYFIKTAELLHFTRAAEALHVSQPTLSLQIQQLETELGALVFERVGRKIYLTEAGRVFLEHVRRALREIEGGQQGIDDLRGLLRGALRIGVTYSFCANSVTDTLAAFLKMYPAVHISLTETTSRGVEQGLLNADFDLGMVFQRSITSAFQGKELFKEDIIIVTSRKHPLAESKSLRFQDLKDVRLALSADGFTTRNIINAKFTQAGILPHVVLETNDIDALLAVVRSGVAATILPRQAVSHLVDLAKIPFQEEGLFSTAALIWPNGTQLTSAGNRFVEMISKELMPVSPN